MNSSSEWEGERARGQEEKERERWRDQGTINIFSCYEQRTKHCAVIFFLKSSRVFVCVFLSLSGMSIKKKSGSI